MSKIYIEVGNNHIVTKVHRFPFDPKYGLNMSKEELENNNGVFVDEVPDPDMKEGKRAVMKYNSDTGQVYYDYETIPLSNKDRISNIESILNELIMNGKL